jgi:peptide/nickel transport system permease protein
MTQAIGSSGLFDEMMPPRNLWLDAWDRFQRNKMAVVGLVIAVLTLLLGIFGPPLAPYDYKFIDMRALVQPPSLEHPMGTDEIGRDMLSRILQGARTAVMVAIFVTVINTVLGLVLGTLSAYMGGIVDMTIMRITDILMAFPGLLLVAFVNATMKRPVGLVSLWLYDLTGIAFFENTLVINYLIVLWAISLIGWPGLARLVRGQILSLREREFIKAQVAMGSPGWRIMALHLIPNAIGPLIVAVSASIGGAMVLESSLSYLGLGIQPPGASWGRMIVENMLQWSVYPHLVAMPSLVLAICVFGFNFLGDGLNDALNPRQIQS